MLCNHQIDINHAFAHFLGDCSLLIFDFNIDFVLLLTWEDSTLSIIQPYGHIII